MSKAADTTKTPPLSPVGPVLLVAVSAALSLLAVFQWMELRVLAYGGSTICGISEAMDCGKVWASDFANKIHAAVGMPIAALGLVYGLTALALSLALVHQALAARPVGSFVVAIRLTALLGVLVSITMAVASIRLGNLCLTCLATYALVIALTVVSVKLLPGPLSPPDLDLKRGIVFAGVFGGVAYLLLLYPGIRTKKPGEQKPEFPVAQQQQQQAGGDAHNHGSPLEEMLAHMEPMERRALRDELQRFRTETVPPGVGRFQTRYRKGPESAPVKIVDFVDIRCGHCRALEETLAAIGQSAPVGSFSVEPRHFPLDSECNKTVSRTDGSGTSCAGAKAQICLEGTDFLWKARNEMFAEQETLTRARVLEIASKGPLTREQLEACIGSPETQAKIDEDVEYALAYQLEGTPLVLVNGREGSPMGAFLYAMVMTGGNLSHPDLKPVLEGR